MGEKEKTDRKTEIDKKTRDLLILCLAFAVCFCLCAIPMPGVRVRTQRCLAIFAFMMILLLFQPIHFSIAAMLEVAMFVLLGVAEPGEVMAAFGTSSTYMIVLSFVMACAITKSNLARRLVLKVLSMMKFSQWKITFGFTVVNILLTYFTSNMMMRMVIVLPIALAFVEECRTESAPKDNQFTKSVLFTVLLTNLTMGGAVLIATANGPVTNALLESMGGTPFSYMEWLLFASPVCIVTTLAAWMGCVLVFRAKPGDIREDLNETEMIRVKLKEMGKMSAFEYAAIMVQVFAIAGWIWGGHFGIDATTVAILGAVIISLPKVGFLGWEDWKTAIPWDMLLLLGGMVALGNMLNATGASSLIGSVMFRVLGFENMSENMGMLLLCVLMGLFHVFFCGTGPMTNSFIPITLSMASIAGWNMRTTAAAMTIIITGLSFMLCHCCTLTLMVKGTNLVSASDFPKVGVPLTLIGSLIVWLAYIFYWPHLGIF